MIIELTKSTYLGCLERNWLNKLRLGKTAKKISSLKNTIKVIITYLFKLLIWTLMKRRQHFLRTLGGQIFVLVTAVDSYEPGILGEAGTTPTSDTLGAEPLLLF